MYVCIYVFQRETGTETDKQTNREREISNKTNREEKCFDFHIRYIRVKT